jgi:hypothetical protein
MAWILAVEPDRKQASRVAALAKGQLHVEILIVDSAAQAVEELRTRVPDLILTSLLLSPKDDALLTERLRAMDAEGAPVPTLTIPVLGSASRRSGGSAGLLKRLTKGRDVDSGTEGCDPAIFAAQIREYLDHAAAEREAKADADRPYSLPEPYSATAAQSFRPFSFDAPMMAPIADPSPIQEPRPSILYEPRRIHDPLPATTGEPPIEDAIAPLEEERIIGETDVALEEAAFEIEPHVDDPTYAQVAEETPELAVEPLWAGHLAHGTDPEEPVPAESAIDTSASENVTIDEPDVTEPPLHADGALDESEAGEQPSIELAIDEADVPEPMYADAALEESEVVEEAALIELAIGEADLPEPMYVDAALEESDVVAEAALVEPAIEESDLPEPMYADATTLEESDVVEEPALVEPAIDAADVPEQIYARPRLDESDVVNDPEFAEFAIDQPDVPAEIPVVYAAPRESAVVTDPAFVEFAEQSDVAADLLSAEAAKGERAVLSALGHAVPAGWEHVVLEIAGEPEPKPVPVSMHEDHEIAEFMRALTGLPTIELVDPADTPAAESPRRRASKRRRPQAPAPTAPTTSPEKPGAESATALRPAQEPPATLAGRTPHKPAVAAARPRVSAPPATSAAPQAEVKPTRHSAPAAEASATRRPANPTAVVPTPPAQPVATAAVAVKPRVESMKTASAAKHRGTHATSPAAAKPRHAPATPPPGKPNAPAKKKESKKPARPVQDEWGFFDPMQCGFAALLAKLDEITEKEKAAARRKP